MKKYKIVMLPTAKNDLADMVEYLSQFYPSTALNRYDRIVEKISLLADMPNMCEEYPTAVSGYSYRKMIVDDYLVFYVVLEDIVEIHNIINGKFDISKYLNR